MNSDASAFLQSRPVGRTTELASLTYFHEYLVREYYAKSRSLSSAKHLMRKVAEDLIHLHVEGSAKPNLFSIAHALGAEVVSNAPLPEGQDGFIRSYGDHLQICIAEAPDTTRGRFTIAHELGHAIYYRFCNGSFSRVIPVPAPKSREAIREEALASQFAGALVFPDALHRSLMRGTAGTVTFQQMIAFAEHFSCSFEVIVRRLLHELHSSPGSIVIRSPKARHSSTMGSSGAPPKAFFDPRVPQRIRRMILEFIRKSATEPGLPKVEELTEWFEYRSGYYRWHYTQFVDRESAPSAIIPSRNPGFSQALMF